MVVTQVFFFFLLFNYFYYHYGLVPADWLYKLNLAVPPFFFLIFSHYSLRPIPTWQCLQQSEWWTGTTAAEVLTLAHSAGNGSSVCSPFHVIISQLQENFTGVCFKYDRALLLFLGNTTSQAHVLSSRHLIWSFTQFLPVCLWLCENCFETTLCKNVANVYVPLGTQSSQHFHEELICRVRALILQVPFARQNRTIFTMSILGLSRNGTAVMCSNWTWRAQWRAFTRLVGAASRSKVSRCFGRIWRLSFDGSLPVLLQGQQQWQKFVGTNRSITTTGAACTTWAG